MKNLLKLLSPFAPDQSGASAVLYELGGLMVICDAGGSLYGKSHSCDNGGRGLWLGRQRLWL